jgi:hypothetical protein
MSSSRVSVFMLQTKYYIESDTPEEHIVDI